MKFTLSYLLVLFSLLFACGSPGLQSRALPLNKFADATIRNIYTLQDERKPETLLPYLKHGQALYRKEAALALASVQDKSAVPGLISLLVDSDATVRQAAAYALGQVGDTTAEAKLIQFATTEKTPAVRAEIAEALGKCATQKGLDLLSSANWTDAREKAGQAWGLYRTNAKNLNYAPAVTKALDLIKNTQAQPVRLGAAHFLARTPRLDLTSHQAQLLTVAQTDPSPEVRMAAVLALGKVKTPATVNGLYSLVQKDPDYRVRINAIRALSTADFPATKEVVYAALNDKNVNTAVAAADFLLAKAPAPEAEVLLRKANQNTNWRVRAILLAAALKNSSDKLAVTGQIKQRYTGSKNNYEKGALLSALGQEVNNYAFIRQETFSGASTVLASYGLQALLDIRQQENFPPALKAPFATIIRQALESGDGALVGIAAGILATPALGFKEAYPDPSFLKAVRAKLVLPRDMETYQELDKAIRYFEGLPPGPAPQNPFTHPINWATVQTLKPQQKVLLKTAKGNITLTLFTEEAPATVANFVELAQAGFFNQKNFHRVVPNFVAQGGDPRGDGWGGTDYALRSELANLRYDTGYVGMASAGKDTESCQWFITHSPTPHLDGRYTIFARVTAGMDLVHQLEIGDIIQSVHLIN